MTQSEDSKKRIEELCDDFCQTHDRNNDGKVFSPWSFKEGYRFGMQDPESNSERIKQLEGLLGECESVVTTFIHGVMDFKGCHREVKLMDKLSDTIVVMNKIRQLKAAKEGGK